MKKIESFIHAGSLAAQCGYRGMERFVLAYWEPAGDELAMGDRYCRGAGMFNHRAYQEWKRTPGIARQLDDYNLGSSDGPAEHALVLDRLEGCIYVTEIHNAERIVNHQELPGPACALCGQFAQRGLLGYGTNVEPRIICEKCAWAIGRIVYDGANTSGHGATGRYSIDFSAWPAKTQQE